VSYDSPAVTVRTSPLRVAPRALALALALAAALPAGTSRAAASDRDAAMTEARARIAEGALDAARAIYARLLSADPSDDEARFGLARIDAWQGRLAEAEGALRDLLTRHPADADVRASLVDVLTWRGRGDEASRVLDDGLARDPASPPLLARRAAMRHRRGDEALAIEDADRAEAATPGDADVRALRDRLFHGEARLTARVEVFSAGLPTLPAGTMELLQRVDRWSLGVRSEQGARFATAGGGRDYAALYGASVGRALGTWSVAIDGGVGAPAKAIPRWFAQVSGEGPLVDHLGARLAIGHRRYANELDVETAAPALFWSPSDAVTLAARYWLALVRSPDAAVAAGAERTRAVHSFGAGLTLRRGPRLAIGFDYAYGAQVDLVPEIFRITDVRAHVIDAWLDALVTRGLGVRPMYRFETRATDAFRYQVHAFEVAAYTRW
jgi:tetratricopeptide (TPR) repeat protein